MDAAPPFDHTPMERAAAAVGGVRPLAKLCHVTYQAVQKWIDSRIPAERVLEVERHTGVSRHELRPDLYPRDGTWPGAQTQAIGQRA